MAKLIYSTTLAAFEKAFPDYKSESSQVYRSIAHTGDGYIITHGTKMFTVVNGSADNPYGLNLGLNGQTLSVTLGNTNKSVDLPVVGLLTDTQDILSLSSINGIFKINHNLGNLSWTDNQIVGPNKNDSDSITVPQITFDKYGHYKSVTNRTATLNLVKQNLNIDNTIKYLLFGNSSTSITGETEFSTYIKAIPSLGELLAKKFTEDGISISLKYAPIEHSSTTTNYGVGTSSNYGHLKLSDAIDSISTTSLGTAATPKAIKDALDSAKLYASDLFSTNDAMLFVGTIDASTGIIITVNSAIATKYNIIANTTKISTLSNYNSGWTFKVAISGTIANIGTLEVGDMLIASNDKGSSYLATDWSVILTNIDGAVTSVNALVANSIILGNGNKAIKSLINGTDNLVLKIINNVPTWSADNSTRAIKLNGTEFLAANNSTALDFISGSNVSITSGSEVGKLTISSVNTWRNITAFKLSIGAPDLVLSTSVGTADLDFGNEFIWDDSAEANGGRLHLGWAEIDSNGNITYTI